MSTLQAAGEAESAGRSGVEKDGVRFSKTQASVLLDLLRGTAALLVLLEHWRNVLFVDYHEVAAHRLLWAPAYLASSCGISSVILFFVLSGYLVGGSVLRTFQRGTWNWRDYLSHRLVRLWIVLLPALAICGVLDTIGLRLPFAYALYHGMSGDHVVLNVTLGRSAGVLLGNVFFLQKIRCTTYGSAFTLWSLANEFWYYLLFPLGVLAFRGVLASPRKAKTWRVVLYGAAALGILLFVGRGIALLFPVWLLGVLVTWLPPLRVGARGRWVAGLVYLVPFVSFHQWTIGENRSNYTLGVLTALLLWVMLSARSAETGRLWERAARRLSSFSFSLYLLHTPVLVLLAAWFVRHERFQPGMRAMPVTLGILLVILAASYALALGTEYRMNEARVWLERRLGMLRT